ncbi:hypothetical protein M514_28289, partial [Trichuris suis]
WTSVIRACIKFVATGESLHPHEQPVFSRLASRRFLIVFLIDVHLLIILPARRQKKLTLLIHVGSDGMAQNPETQHSEDQNPHGALWISCVLLMR